MPRTGCTPRWKSKLPRPSDGYGMHGSGMFIINPPWTLERKLHETLPKLTELMAQGEGAKYTLESQTD